MLHSRLILFYCSANRWTGAAAAGSSAASARTNPLHIDRLRPHLTDSLECELKALIERRYRGSTSGGLFLVHSEIYHSKIPAPASSKLTSP